MLVAVQQNVLPVETCDPGKLCLVVGSVELIFLLSTCVVTIVRSTPLHRSGEKLLDTLAFKLTLTFPRAKCVVGRMLPEKKIPETG